MATCVRDPCQIEFKLLRLTTRDGAELNFSVLGAAPGAVSFEGQSKKVLTGCFLLKPDAQRGLLTSSLTARKHQDSLSELLQLFFSGVTTADLVMNCILVVKGNGSHHLNRQHFYQ